MSNDSIIKIIEIDGPVETMKDIIKWFPDLAFLEVSPKKNTYIL